MFTVRPISDLAQRQRRSAHTLYAAYFLLAITFFAGLFLGFFAADSPMKIAGYGLLGLCIVEMVGVFIFYEYQETLRAYPETATWQIIEKGSDGLFSFSPDAVSHLKLLAKTQNGNLTHGQVHQIWYEDEPYRQACHKANRDRFLAALADV